MRVGRRKVCGCVVRLMRAMMLIFMLIAMLILSLILKIMMMLVSWSPLCLSLPSHPIFYVDFDIHVDLNVDVEVGVIIQDDLDFDVHDDADKLVPSV